MSEFSHWEELEAGRGNKGFIQALM